MQKISDKLYNWASIIDPNTLEQARVTSSMPFIFPHLALMPDAHLGKGSTVGSVIPTLKAIIPAAVGVDIGCGMIAVKTQFNESDLANRERLTVLRQSIERSIPLSAGGYNREYTATARKRITELEKLHDHRATFRDNISPNWRLQLGSLGSGNHFIEVSLDEENNVWLFLHSGSRGVGNKLASHHIKVAQEYCKNNNISLPHPDLAYLVEGTPEFEDYTRDLAWAQHFALLNREEMMDRVIKDFNHWIGSTIQEQERVNCHHNFTVQEEHFGKMVYLSRKGAINAHKGVAGLIPGSMGTASYVVEGKGNIMGLCTAPHGAGRVFSRGEARRTFTVEQLREAMKGIEYRDTDAFIDEIPAAYKDIDVVMLDAVDLVDIKHTLRQIVNVKGD
jgi:tRNA-splicing ligase RtcB